MANTTTNTNTTKSLHPVYTVTDIQRKVRVLDGTKLSYSSWVKLFKLHARGYDVLSHIDGSPSPAKTDASYEEWSKIDAIVLQWIYGTLDDDLLVQILVPESTALEAWNRLKDIFLNNKGARAAALELEFNNLILKSMTSLESYCQKLKTLGDQLTDVDCPVNDTRLVLQLVRGLPREYDAAGSIINQTLPSPSWEMACHMLHSEHQRQKARDLLDTPAAMAAVRSDNQTDHRRANNSRGGSRHGDSHRGGGRGGRTHGNFNGPRPNNSWPHPSGSQQFGWAGWTPPPSPYPTQPWTGFTPWVIAPWMGKQQQFGVNNSSPQQTWRPTESSSTGPSSS